MGVIDGTGAGTGRHFIRSIDILQSGAHRSSDFLYPVDFPVFIAIPEALAVFGDQEPAFF